MTSAKKFYAGYDDLFDRACKISETFESTASAFVPAIPENWQAGGILYFGSATYGWDLGANGFDLAYSAEESNSLMQNYPKRSRFWQLAFELQHRLGGLPLAWSNLHKIGSDNHEPSKRLREAQMDLSADSYRYEVETLKPGVVVFSVGDLASETVPHCLGEGNWDNWIYDEEKVVMARADLEVPTIWLSRRRRGTNRARIDNAIQKLTDLPNFRMPQTVCESPT